MTKFRLGLAITVLWILGAVSFLRLEWTDAIDMKPNAWADFFAGAFSPLAFLWLVLGYLQQGDELQLSTKALQLQADELKHSVEQQRALVDVTRQQIDAEREISKQEQHARSVALQPHFVVSPHGVNRSGSEYKYALSLVNRGTPATRVFVLADVGLAERMVVLSEPYFVTDTERSAVIALNGPFPDENGRLEISYTDALGAPGKYAYVISRTQGQPEIPLTFTPLVG